MIDWHLMSTCSYWWFEKFPPEEYLGIQKYALWMNERNKILNPSKMWITPQLIHGQQTGAIEEIGWEYCVLYFKAYVIYINP